MSTPLPFWTNKQVKMMKKNFASKKPIETFLDILQVYGTKIGGYMIFFSQGTIDWVDKFSFF